MFENSINAFLKRHNYISFMPRAALIDMDGTLYDSMPKHAAAWRRMTAEIGMDIPLEEFYLHEGRTGASTINILFKKHFGREATVAEIKHLYSLKTQYFSEMPPASPMPGATDLLNFLKSVGMKMVLVTGSGQHSLISRIDSDFPGIFDPGMKVTSSEVTNGKPAPDPYLLAMRKAMVEPSQSIVIENAPLGVQSGDAAGAFTVGITTGPIPTGALTEAGAALVFPTMKDLAEKMPLLIYGLITNSRNFS